jgi:uncharacterized protein YegP (UPF0339 family)
MQVQRLEGAAGMKFEIRNSSSSSQRYYWRIVASNGAVLATSETYVAKQSCIDAINIVKGNAAGAVTYDHTRTAVRR